MPRSTTATPSHSAATTPPRTAAINLQPLPRPERRASASMTQHTAVTLRHGDRRHRAHASLPPPPRGLQHPTPCGLYRRPTLNAATPTTRTEAPLCRGPHRSRPHHQTLDDDATPLLPPSDALLPKRRPDLSESFPLRVTGWPVELMAYAFLVVSPPEMSQRFEEMAVVASNKSSSMPGFNYPELEEQALQFILDCCESNIAKYTKFVEGANGSHQVSTNAKQASRTLLLKQLARDLCISERRIFYHLQYILRRRLRDMRGGELRALSLFNGLRKLFK